MSRAPAASARSTRRARSVRSKRPMPKPGSRRSPPKSSADCARAAVALALAGAIGRAPVAMAGEPLRPYTVVGDAIPDSLTGRSRRSRPAAARSWSSRQTGLCLLCHSGPFPEERFQGDARARPRRRRRALVGGAAALAHGRQCARLNPATIMPSYYRIEGLTRVGRAWQGKPVLSAEQIEDVVAFLATLRS